MIKYKLDYVSQLFLRNHVKIYLILLAVSFFAMLLASYTTHIQVYPPDPFYLFTSLSIYYWIGIFFLITVISLRILVDSPNARVVQLIDLLTLCLLTFYFSIVTFIYPTIRYVDSYYFYWYLLKPIISAGTTNIDVDYGSMYHTIFNGATIYFTSLFQLDLSPHIISNFVPILVIFLGSFFTYVLSMHYSNRYPLVGGIIFIIFNWDACHMAPQHLIYIISFCLIYLVLSLFKNPKNEKRYMSLILICLTTIVLSHLLASIIILYFLICLFVTLALLQFCYRRYMSISCFTHFTTLFNQMKEYCSKKNLLILPILYIFVTFTSYLTFLSVRYFTQLVTTTSTVIHSLIEPNEIVLMHRTVVNTIPSDSYMLVYELRMCVLFLYLILGTLFSLTILYLNIRKTKYTQNIPYSTMIIISFFSLFSFGGVLLATGNSIYGFDRSYPLSLVPFGILGTIVLSLKSLSLRSVKINKHLILLVIVLIILALPILKYGSDPYHFFSESEDKANQFGVHHIEKFDLTLYEENTFSNMMYNSKVLKEQAGFDYKNQFISKQLNLIYNVGDTCHIFGEI